MKKAIVFTLVGAFLGAGTAGMADVLPQFDDFYFWRLGHMDGPHDESKALGISRDGKVAVGSTMVVDFRRAWRLDIDWAIATDDAVPPLYNELQVQEDIGIVVPSQPSAAYAASDMTTTETCTYDKVAGTLNWCESKPVGTLNVGTVSYAAQWLLPVLDSVDDSDYVTIPDFGGGLADMKALDTTPDGTVMVGYGTNKKGQQAFRADMTDPLLPVLRTLTITDSVYTEQTLQSSVAQAVSADGMIIAGYGATKVGNRAFVTTVDDASVDPITLTSVVLPNIAGGKFAEAYAMTPDGAVIAGRSDSPMGPQACIWFVDTTTGLWVVKPLGGLSTSKLDSVAYGIAYRDATLGYGSLMVVGRSASILYPSEAFVWAGDPVIDEDDPAVGTTYMYDLEYILIKTGAGTASTMGSSWILYEATGISDDGTRIVGWGKNPEGGIEAYAVTGYPDDICGPSGVELAYCTDTTGTPEKKPKKVK